ncbi:MAG: sulfotransferase [Candidatus Woesearchaeota archaeon]
MRDDNNNIILILGHGRSGTTLLNKVLCSHPNIFIIGNEINDLSFFHSNQHIYKKYGRRKYYMMIKDMYNHPDLRKNKKGIDDKNLKRFIKIHSLRDFFYEIFDLFRKKNKKNLIGIKISNNFAKNVDMIKDLFKCAYCIHIIRDPRDVFISLRNTRFGTKSPFYAAKSWKYAIDKIRSLKTVNRRYYEIRYEKLISQPEKELKKLCKFLNLEFSRNMLTFYKRTGKIPAHHKMLKQGFTKDNCNKWKKELNKKELDLIYAAAGRKIYELGYSNKIIIKKISLARRIKEFIYEKIHFSLRLFSSKETFKLINGIYVIKTRLKRSMGLSKSAGTTNQ